ncbi:MAG: DUF4142 domain-containing protein [Planctomycetaceae bacterium]
MSTRFRILLAFGVVVVAASLLVAQERAATQKDQSQGKQNKTAQNRDQGSTQRDDAAGQAQRGLRQKGAGQWAPLDQYVLSCAMSENEAEISISKIAQQRASNPQVKQFAEKMIKDHTAFLQKLRSAQSSEDKQDQQGRAAGDSPKTKALQAKRDPAEKQPQLKVPRIGRGATAVDQGDYAARVHGIPVQTLIGINDEIHERCLATLQQELEQKEGAEFDRCFMGFQVGAHMKIVDALDVLQNHVSPELKQILSEGADTSKQHLTQAKDLMAQVEGKATGAQTPQQRDANTSRKREPQNK